MSEITIKREDPLQDIFDEMATAMAEHEDAFLVAQFERYGFSVDEVIQMIADERVTVEVVDNIKYIRIDDEVYFALEYLWNVTKLEDSIVCHDVKEAVKREEE